MCFLSHTKALALGNSLQDRKRLMRSQLIQRTKISVVIKPQPEKSDTMCKPETFQRAARKQSRVARENGCDVAALGGGQSAGRLGRGQQGKDVEEEFGAERTGSTERRAHHRAIGLGMLRWKMASMAEQRHHGKVSKEVDGTGGQS